MIRNFAAERANHMTLCHDTAFHATNLAVLLQIRDEGKRLGFVLELYREAMWRHAKN